MNKIDENKLLGNLERHQSRSAQWMFNKAHEIGFSEIEVELLKSIYDPLKHSGSSQSK
jgi:hypothetical protein